MLLAAAEFEGEKREKEKKEREEVEVEVEKKRPLFRRKKRQKVSTRIQSRMRRC